MNQDQGELVGGQTTAGHDESKPYSESTASEVSGRYFVQPENSTKQTIVQLTSVV